MALEYNYCFMYQACKQNETKYEFQVFNYSRYNNSRYLDQKCLMVVMAMGCALPTTVAGWLTILTTFHQEVPVVTMQQCGKSLLKPERGLSCFINLNQQLSTRVTFFPSGKHLVMSRGSFGCHNWQGGAYWHLVGRGQGRCYTNTTHHLTLKNYQVQMSIVLRLRTMIQKQQGIAHNIYFVRSILENNYN